MSILVGIWSVNTVAQTNGSWITLPFHQKMNRLKRTLARFENIRRQESGFGPFRPNDIRAIFAAPEYLFAPTDANGDRHYYEDLGGQKVTSVVKRLIPSYRNMLIVPGSIAHRKRRTRARQQKYAAGVYNNDNIKNQQTHLGNLFTDGKTHYARNTAYAFFEGRKTVSCHKQSDATDGFRATDPEAFVPGFGTNRFNMRVGGVHRSIGLEICADSSGVGNGAHGYQLANNNGNMNVKILMSAVLQAQHVFGNYDHCLIHACSDRTHSGVTTRGNGRQAQRLVNRSGAVEGHPLDVYRVTL